MRKHYIYCYIDPRDGIVRYIGQGQNERWVNSHKHNEQYGVYPWLQRLKALGLKPVRFIVLESLTQSQADKWEIDLIDLIGRRCEKTGPLLNLSVGGRSGSSGCRRSAETLRRMSESQKGRKGKTPTAETCRKLSEALSGRTLSKSHRRKIGKANEGKVRSKVTRRKLSESHKGNIPSEETRVKMSAAQTGRVCTVKTRRKISKAKKGHVVSEDTRRKISETKRRDNQLTRKHT